MNTNNFHKIQKNIYIQNFIKTPHSKQYPSRNNFKMTKSRTLSKIENELDTNNMNLNNVTNENNKNGVKKLSKLTNSTIKLINESFNNNSYIEKKKLFTKKFIRKRTSISESFNTTHYLIQKRYTDVNSSIYSHRQSETADFYEINNNNYYLSFYDNLKTNTANNITLNPDKNKKNTNKILKNYIIKTPKQNYKKLFFNYRNKLLLEFMKHLHKFFIHRLKKEFLFLFYYVKNKNRFSINNTQTKNNVYLKKNCTYHNLNSSFVIKKNVSLNDLTKMLLSNKNNTANVKKIPIKNKLIKNDFHNNKEDKVKIKLLRLNDGKIRNIFLDNDDNMNKTEIIKPKTNNSFLTPHISLRKNKVNPFAKKLSVSKLFISKNCYIPFIPPNLGIQKFRYLKFISVNSFTILKRVKKIKINFDTCLKKKIKNKRNEDLTLIKEEDEKYSYSISMKDCSKIVK